MSKHRDPLVSIEYVDPFEGVRGFLVIDRLIGGLCAGGLRVRPELNRQELTDLARNMTLKQAAAGIQVGGAKAGLAMDPRSDKKAAVLQRFLETLRPVITEMWSCGPDMNTTMVELETIARQAGIPSLKIAVGRRRGLNDEEFLRRYELFEQSVGGMTVNELRGPAATAAATEVLLRRCSAKSPARVAIQGSGNMGGGVARLLASSGVRVVAWADDQKCLVDRGGLDVEKCLAGRSHGRLPAIGESRPSNEIFDTDCDVIILAAVSYAFDDDTVPRLRCRGIVQAANLALNHRVEATLHERGILIVPDLVASVGGSLAVEALYSTKASSGADILGHVRSRASELTDSLLDACAAERCTPRASAMNRAEQNLMM
jgi:glutamate dehydrogenase (NAD(P)+)